MQEESPRLNSQYCQKQKANKQKTTTKKEKKCLHQIVRNKNPNGYVTNDNLYTVVTLSFFDQKLFLFHAFLDFLLLRFTVGAAAIITY